MKSVGRRTGRAELDEHAEGVHSSEIDVDLDAVRPQPRGGARRHPRAARRAAGLASTSASRSRTGSTTCSRACARRSRSRSTARTSTRCAAWPSSLQQTPAPASRARRPADREAGAHPAAAGRVDYERAALYGVTPASDHEALETLSNGRVVSQIVDGNRRFDVVLRLSDEDRTTQRPVEPAGRDARRAASRSRLFAAGRSRPTGRTRSSARTAGGASSCSANTDGCATWPRSSPTSARSSPSRSCRRATSPAWRARSRRRRRRRGRIAPAVAGVAGADLPGALQPLPLGGAGADHHGQRAAGADRQRRRAVDRRPAALGRHA